MKGLRHGEGLWETTVEVRERAGEMGPLRTPPLPGIGETDSKGSMWVKVHPWTREKETYVGLAFLVANPSSSDCIPGGHETNTPAPISSGVLQL